MKTEELKLFLHLAQSLNFARTARECYLSPSTLSRTIQRMEQEVGCRLFQRSNKAVSITPEGDVFQKFAEQYLNQWGQLRIAISQRYPTLTGNLSLFCSVTAAHSLLPTLLAQFRINFPAIKIDLEVGNSLSALNKLKQRDLIVTALPPQSPLEKILLTQTPLIFVGKKPIPSLWLQEKIPLIVPRSGLSREAVDRWLAVQKDQPSFIQETSGSEAVLALVALGCGVGVVPKLLLEKSPLVHRLQILGTEEQLGSLKVFLARAAKPLSPAAQILWESALNQSIFIQPEKTNSTVRDGEL